MALAIPALLALLLSLATGGSLRQLAALPLRNGEFILLSLLVQLVIYLPGVRAAPFVMHYSGAIYITSLAVALLGVLRNWHLGLALRVAACGLLLNLLVICANGGHMPVNRAALRIVLGAAKVQELVVGHVYANTQLASSATRLVFLSDHFPVHVGDVGNVYSVGDFVLITGVSALIFIAARRRAPVSAQRGRTVATFG